MKKSNIKGIKELLRIVLIATIPIFITSVNLKTGQIHIDWTLIQGMTFLALVKGLDKWVHENPDIESDGILPF